MASAPRSRSFSRCSSRRGQHALDGERRARSLTSGLRRVSAAPRRSARISLSTEGSAHSSAKAVCGATRSTCSSSSSPEPSGRPSRQTIRSAGSRAMAWRAASAPPTHSSRTRSARAAAACSHACRLSSTKSTRAGCPSSPLMGDSSNNHRGSAGSAAALRAREVNPLRPGAPDRLPDRAPPIRRTEPAVACTEPGSCA